MKKLLIASLAANVAFLIVSLSAAYGLREKILQKRIELIGKAKISMLGDSHIEAGNWNWKLGRTDIITVGRGGFMSSQIASLLKIVVCYRPAYCFVLAGTNDIESGGNTPKTIRNYEAIADTLRTHKITPIFQTVFYLVNNPFVNASTDTLNHELTIFCKNECIDLIDVNKALAQNHHLRNDLARPDGVHLNEKGYAIWAGLLKNYISAHKID